MISTSHVTTAEHDETPFFWVVGGWAGGGGRRCGGFSERESGEEFFSSFLRRRKRRSSDAIERRSLNLFSFTRRSLLAFSPFNFPTSIFWMAPEWKPRSKKKRWARKGPTPNEVNIWSSNSKERASSRRPPDSKSPHASPPPSPPSSQLCLIGFIAIRIAMKILICFAPECKSGSKGKPLKRFRRERHFSQ